jgi:ankyrin repeat protein
MSTPGTIEDVHHYRAAVKGHDATVRLLLEQGANRRAEDQYQSTALSLAAYAGYEK